MTTIMEYTQALQKLQNHANMPNSGLPESEGFLFTLWQSDRNGQIPELHKYFEDMLACLKELNRIFNTINPSGNIEGKKEDFPRALVADVSAIISEGWAYHCAWTQKGVFSDSFRLQLAHLLLQIGIAWEAVLAGDIDNLEGHVEAEYLAKWYNAYRQK